MRRTLFKGKSVLVFGLGVHGGGVAVAKWLARHGAKVTVTDKKIRTELAASLRQLKGLPITYALGRHNKGLLHGAHIIVRNPAVRQDQPVIKVARRLGIPIENEASLFLKLCPTKRLAAVTGSKGKSTTTAMLGRMLKTRFKGALAAGNIRDTVLFQVLDGLKPEARLALELSSWQLEEVGDQRLRIPVAVITNVLPEHLNTYRSFAAYARAKAGIFKGQAQGDALVLNFDNQVTRRMVRQTRGRVYWFSVLSRPPRGAYVKGGQAYWVDAGRITPLFSVSDVKLRGEHNLANALAAAAAAKLIGVPTAGIQRALRTFTGLHDRLELVRTWRGIRFVNDTTATAPVASVAALESFRGERTVLIAGGTDKSLPYKDMARAIRKHAAALVLLPGTATQKLKRELKSGYHYAEAHSMSEAVSKAAKLARPGGVVLLSPGAASFGLFQHEFDRGQAFVKAVRRLR